MRARAELAPGCVVHRTIVVMDDYLVDRVEWQSDGVHEVALPFHGVHVVEPGGEPIAGAPATIEGATGARTASGSSPTRDDSPQRVRYVYRSNAAGGPDAQLHGWLATSEPATWWSAVAPGPPGHAPQPLALVRATAARGSITGVWSWRGAVIATDLDREALTVRRADGTVHLHRPKNDGWLIEQPDGSSRVIALGSGAANGAASAPAASRVSAQPAPRPIAHTLPRRRELGESAYRGSEQSWEEAGRPAAVVSLEQSADRLIVRVDVPRAERRFVAIDAENPFDNDPAAIHGDGVQLYVAAGDRAAGWLLGARPGLDPRRPPYRGRVARRAAPRRDLAADRPWVHARRNRDAALLGISAIDVDVLVNETAPGRSRRRGQLLLSGSRGEFVYLRADRHERERLLRFAVGNV